MMRACMHACIGHLLYVVLGMALDRGVSHPRAPGTAGVPVLRAVGGVGLDGGGPDQVSLRLRAGFAPGACLNDFSGQGRAGSRYFVL